MCFCCVSEWFVKVCTLVPGWRCVIWPDQSDVLRHKIKVNGWKRRETSTPLCSAWENASMHSEITNRAGKQVSFLSLFFSFSLFSLFSFFVFESPLFCPFRQHVPFRESKLTHYLQGYFTGRGKACMIVNINQCASMYDETLNVLKFSAVAQKVCNILICMHLTH